MQKYMEITTERGIMRGMVHVPDGGAVYPGVVMLHGFTGNRMEPNFLFVRFSRILEEAGIASIRMDFICSGESDGEFEDMTFSGEAEEAEIILDHFRSLDYIDTNRVAVLGLSMGGALAGYLAGRRSSDVSGLVLWAPGGEMRLLFEEKERMAASGEITGDIMDLGGLRLGEGFVDDIKSVEILKTTAAYSGDSLIIHGTGDKTVPYKVSLEYEKLFGGRGELLLIRDADHTFKGIPWRDELYGRSLSYLKKKLS